MKCSTSYLKLIIPILFFGMNARAQVKLAQTGFQFLSVGVDARAAAMGEAFTSMAGSSAALFYNPAGLAGVSGMADIAVSRMNWIADIDYLSGSMALKISGGKYGIVGLSFLTVNYGEFLWTRVADNDQGFEDIEGWGEPKSLMVGLGYAKELTDRFAVGGQVKYVVQDLGQSYVPVYSEADTTIDEEDYSLGVLAFDLGTMYRTGFKSLVFGMSVRNFSRELKYEREGFQLPLTFKIGISMNVFDFMPNLFDNHALWISLDAVHPRSYTEYLNIGGEYVLMDILALRAGYITNQDNYGFTSGFGIRRYGLALDYSYTPFDFFDNVNRFSFRFSF